MDNKLTKTEEAYFDRHLKLAGFGRQAQEWLKAAKVLVVGAGGLGCPVLQYLATAGVGHIGVIDHDVVSFHNLHRQVLFTPDDVGKNKAETAARKLANQVPFVKFSIYMEALSVRNALEVMDGYDLVIDGTDNFETRYLVNDACVIQGIPFVSGAIDRYTGQVSVFNYQDGPTYRCLYPEAPENCGSCSIDGVLNVLPGIVGTLMANEAIKVLGRYGDVLSGKLLVMDVSGNGFDTFHFSPIEENKNIHSLRVDYAPIPAYDEQEIPSAGQYPDDALLVDVRELWEYEEGHEDGHINMPLHELPQRMEELLGLTDEGTPHRPVVFYCTTGKRSRMAVELVKKQGVEAYAERLE